MKNKKLTKIGSSNQHAVITSSPPTWMYCDGKIEAICVNTCSIKIKVFGCNGCKAKTSLGVCCLDENIGQLITRSGNA